LLEKKLTTRNELTRGTGMRCNSGKLGREELNKRISNETCTNNIIWQQPPKSKDDGLKGIRPKLKGTQRIT
jgi:hypothetical protein